MAAIVYNCINNYMGGMGDDMSRKPSVDVLRVAIDEQRKFDEFLTSTFKTQNAKNLTFIAATLALLTFLYAGAWNQTTNVPNQVLSMSERLFIPDDLYGIIFYAAGFLSIAYALVRLFHGSRPGVKWGTPFEPEDFKNLTDKSEKHYMIKLKNEYARKAEQNLGIHAERYKAYSDAFYPLIIGAIIMVVLRYLQ